jgi:multiple sugar transport system permease protein
MKRFLLHLGLTAGAVATLAPLVWMVAASFMPAGQATTYPPRLIPRPFTLENYALLFTRLDIARNLLNSVLIAVAATALSSIINAMAGYAFAKFRFRGRDPLFRTLLAGLVIPAQVGMLPLFVMMKQLHLVNSYWAVIIPSMSSIFGIFLVRQYALSIPDELLDAARIDGASELMIFGRIILPLLRPILVTFAVFMFMSVWNDFMWPLIVLSDDAKYTLPVALANLSGEHVQDTELMMAGAVVTLAPVLAAFLLLQRYYIEGITMGSVKG